MKLFILSIVCKCLAPITQQYEDKIQWSRQRKKKTSGYRILAPPAGITQHKCLQHSLKFSQAKAGSFIMLLRLISPRREDKWSTLLLTPTIVNSPTDTLICCWERTLSLVSTMYEIRSNLACKKSFFFLDRVYYWNTDQACLGC